MKKLILILILTIFIIGCAEKPLEEQSEAISTEKIEEPKPEEILQEETKETEEPEDEIMEKKKETPEPTITNPLNVPRVNTAALISLVCDDEECGEDEEEGEDDVEEGEGFCSEFDLDEEKCLSNSDKCSWDPDDDLCEDINIDEEEVEEESVDKEYRAGLCYLGSFAMLAIYEDSRLDLADVIAYSGVGSNAKYDSNRGLGNGYGESSIISAAKNLGYTYAVGIKQGKKANTPIANFESSASDVKYFKDEGEAFDYLKRIIDSGKPVEVHLNTYYVGDDFKKGSDFWRNHWIKKPTSHFMVVTGYDDNYVYINDPTDPDLSIKNMKAPTKNFLEAWKNGADPKIDGAQVGPYWMLHINENNGQRKSTKEIIAWNKEVSSNAVSQIRKANKKGFNSELGFGRREFGNFLIEKGYSSAGKLYKEAADIYLTDPEDSASFKEIAEKEEQARGLLK